jgi:O-antigen/teichoic acid export membrane protein
MTGTIIAQAIPIAISPILTRIYTPEDFGVIALFLAIFGTFSVIINARYELAIMLPEKESDAINILALSFIINLIFSCVLMVFILVFHGSISEYLNNKDIDFWLYFIPITVFITGLFNALVVFNNRKKYYKDISHALITKSIVISVVQVSIGFIKNGATGLVSGYILAQFFANMGLMKNIVKDKVLISHITLRKIIFLAKKYKDFPKFSLPASLANVLTRNLTSILISSFYGIATLGFYSLVQRVLGLPFSLIGFSVGQVFFQKGTEEKQKTGKTIIIFYSTVKKLIIIGLPIFVVFFFVIEEIFVFVFSDKWRLAGEYAQIMIPLVFITFISGTVDSVYKIFGYLKVELIWEIILFFGTIVIILMSYLADIKFKDLLLCIIFYSFIMRLISLYIMRKISLGEMKFSDKII